MCWGFASFSDSHLKPIRNIKFVQLIHATKYNILSIPKQILEIDQILASLTVSLTAWRREVREYFYSQRIIIAEYGCCRAYFSACICSS